MLDLLVFVHGIIFRLFLCHFSFIFNLFLLEIFGYAGWTKPSPFRDTIELGLETESVEPTVTLIAEKELIVVDRIVGTTDFTGHVLYPLEPLLWSILLGDQPQIFLAVMTPTQASGEGSRVHIELIVETELLSYLDISRGENSHTYFPEYIPLLGLTVGIAGVVNEPGHITLIGRVNYLVPSQFHHVCTGGFTVRIQSLNSLLRIKTQHFPNVLDNELTLLNSFTGNQSKTLASHGLGKHTRIIMKLEISVLTCYRAWAGVFLTFG